MLKWPAVFIAALFLLNCQADPQADPQAAPQAAPDCGEWLTRDFWQEAGAADVERCLGTGADIKARDKGDLTPLHLAAGASNAETVNALLDRGADIKARNLLDWTPLHEAVIDDNAETVNALLDRGADIKARDKKGKIPFDEITDDSALKGTDAYWRLHDGRFK